MASSKTFLFLLALVFTLVVLILSEVSARELTEAANQVEKSGSTNNKDNPYKDPHDKPYGGSEHPCNNPYTSHCQVGGEPGSNNRGGIGGSHERHGEHSPHNHQGEEGGSHTRYTRGGKGGCHERGEHNSPYCGHGGKGKGGRYDRPGGPGSDDETETRN